MKFRLNEGLNKSEVKSAMQAIYDEYEKYNDDDGNQNCMLCAWALEMQLRGNKDFLPRPVYSPRDVIFQDINGYDIVVGAEKLSLENKASVSSIAREAGDGTRFYCHVNWAGLQSGHEFLILNIQDTIYIADAQANALVDIEEDDEYFRDINFENSFLVRLDNKEINEEILKYNDMEHLIYWDETEDAKLLNESSYNNKEFEKFESGETQLLFIVGLSASGKTTLANELSDKYSAEVVNLDKFDIEYNTDNYIKSKDIPNIIEQFTNEVGIVKQGDTNIEKFMGWITKQELNQPVIVEGVQLLSFPETIKDFPIIVLDLPIETLIKQQLDRNEGNWETIIINDKQFDNYEDWKAALIDSYKEQQKELNDFIAACGVI